MRPTEYIAGDRRSRAAHDMELETLRDEFLAEALEGYESVEGDHAAALETLRRRLAERAAQSAPVGPDESPAPGLSPEAEIQPLRPFRIRRPTQRDTSRRWRLMGIAGALLFFLLSGYIITHRPAPQPPDSVLTVLTDADTLRATPHVPDTAVAPPPTVKKRTSAPRRSAPVPDEKVIAARTQPKQGLDAWQGDPRPLDSVVVVAYGTKKKASLTGSVAKSRPADSTLIADLKPVDPEQSVDAKDSTHFADWTEPVVVPVPKSPVTDYMPLHLVDTQPSFQGGDLRAFKEWIQQRIHKPETALANGISGRVVLSFVVEKDGRLTRIEVLQTPDRSLSDDAVKIVESSPRWKPGGKDGKKVRVRIFIPVDYR